MLCVFGVNEVTCTPPSFWVNSDSLGQLGESKWVKGFGHRRLVCHGLNSEGGGWECEGEKPDLMESGKVNWPDSCLWAHSGAKARAQDESEWTLAAQVQGVPGKCTSGWPDNPRHTEASRLITRLARSKSIELVENWREQRVMGRARPGTDWRKGEVVLLP